MQRPPTLNTACVDGQIPPFYFPKKKQSSGGPSSAVCNHLAQDDLRQLALTAEDIEHLMVHLDSLAVPVVASSFQQRLLATHSQATTNLLLVDRFIRERRSLLLSYKNYKELVLGNWAALSTQTKLRRLLPAQCFFALMNPVDRTVNALHLLEYLCETQLVVCVTRNLLNLKSTDEQVAEPEYSNFIQSKIITAARDKTIVVSCDMMEYYQLICTRALLLPHYSPSSRQLQSTRGSALTSLDDLAECPVLRAFIRLLDAGMRMFFDANSSTNETREPRLDGCVYSCFDFFNPDSALSLFKQYQQLDSDRNGLLNISEIQDFGKKRAFLLVQQPGRSRNGKSEPTHDLTSAFVEQVYYHVHTFDGELDFRGYIDFALTMMDNSSTAALRFFWDVLDFQQQGFLDTFTLDFFLRSLLAKIRSHASTHSKTDDDMRGTVSEVSSGVPTIDQLRTQILDAIGPTNPARVTWTDLCRCRVGHTVVRILTDYVAYRAYETSGGRLPAVS